MLIAMVEINSTVRKAMKENQEHTRGHSLNTRPLGPVFGQHLVPYSVHGLNTKHLNTGHTFSI